MSELSETVEATFEGVASAIRMAEAEREADVPSVTGEEGVFLDAGDDPHACPEVWDYLDNDFTGAVQFGPVTEVRARVETWRFGDAAEGDGAYEDVCEIRHVEPGDDPQYGTHFGLRLPGEVMDRLCEAWLSLRRSNREALAAGEGAGDGRDGGGGPGVRRGVGSGDGGDTGGAVGTAAAVKEASNV